MPPSKITNLYSGLIASLLTAIMPLAAKAEISDNALRKLFVISEASAETMAGAEYGGIVLFKSYFNTHKTACELKKRNPKLTVFIDQEGGSVVRIPDAAPPSPTEAKALTDSTFYEAVKQSAQKLKRACIDANFAPVVEISEHNSRSYGTKFEEVARKATIFSTAMQSAGIKTVLKHFPSFQNNCTPLQELDAIQLKVKKGTEALTCSNAQTDSVTWLESINIFQKIPSSAWMLSNHVYEKLGAYPSSMNPEINKMIRTDMVYNGLLISDALWEIEASPRAILLALKVNDWVMVAYPHQVEAALPVIRAALKNRQITEIDIQNKLQRIESFKAH